MAEHGEAVFNQQIPQINIQPDVAIVFQRLAEQMSTLTTAVGNQGITQMVTPFEGDSRHFHDWIKQVEKFCVLTRTPPHEVKLVAYNSSRGPVSDFIARYLNLFPNHNWDRLKTELTGRFGEVSDPSHALVLLRRVKQKPDENVQIYAERLISLAEQAYGGQPQGNRDAAEAQLVGFFIDGLYLDGLKIKLLRDNPRDLNAAVNIAMAEQNLRKRFHLRTSKPSRSEMLPDEPMDIGHIRPNRLCFICKKADHLAKDCRSKTRAHVNVVDRGGGEIKPAYPKGTAGVQNRGNNQGCFNCGSPDHWKRECPFNRRNRRFQNRSHQEN